MKPILHRIVVRKDPVEVKTESGIIVARNERNEKKATVTGTVVTVGSTVFVSFGSTAEAEGVVPGAKVLFAKYAGADLGDDSDLTILNDDDLIAIIPEDKTK